ncbi:MAG: hypothetical protein A2W86_03395 [Bacteroidetes bacterium GWD2_45_23]|nr:MAG: hypothetical protein A2W87_14640 [Bacteroidetes bacterium GWC2_46_850]OFX86147.1 MAG: hypothetical protein A2W86_03395 [Bacteroidetes bacterium GWD2_45_23]HCC17278.1 hypothetical protein [Porphyromonadaceae bacterium]
MNKEIIKNKTFPNASAWRVQNGCLYITRVAYRYICTKNYELSLFSGAINQFTQKLMIKS